MENWRDELPDELKTSPILAKYEEPTQAFKALVELNSRLGRSVVHPTDDSDPEEMSAYYDKLQKTANGKLILHPDAADGEQADKFWELLGKPADTKGYEAPEGLQNLTPEVLENLQDMAHKSGLTKKQFKEQALLFDAQAEIQNQSLESMKAEQRQMIDSRLGLTKDDTMKEIGLLAAQYSDAEVKPGWLDDTSKLTAGDVLFLNNILKQFKGDGPQVFAQPTSQSGKTPEEITEGIERIDKKLLDMSVPASKRKMLLTQKIKLMEMRE